MRSKSKQFQKPISFAVDSAQHYTIQYRTVYIYLSIYLPRHWPQLAQGGALGQGGKQEGGVNRKHWHCGTVEHGESVTVQCDSVRVEECDRLLLHCQCGLWEEEVFPDQLNVIMCVFI